MNKSKKIIGNIGLNSIDDFTRKASMWIAIFDKKNQDKWYGTGAIELLLEYVFDYLWFNKLKLNYIKFNDRVAKVYEKCWFKKVWVLKEESYIMWEYHDEVYMEIMRKDYLKNKK